VLLVALIAIALAVYLFLGFYRAVMRSLREMLAVANRIGQGDVSEAIVVSSRDEVGETTVAFGEAVVEYLHDIAGTAEAVAGGDLAGHGRAAVGA
jgi:methyl-accepting chemotaxis protein